MIVDSSRAVSLGQLEDTIRANFWAVDDFDSEGETSVDLPMATGAGRLSDLLGLTITSSGMRKFYVVEFKKINEKSIALLQKWIEQYGDDCDPDLDEQIRELNANRLSLRERC